MGICGSKEGVSVPGASSAPVELPSFDTKHTLALCTNDKSPLNLYNNKAPRSFAVTGDNCSLQLTYCSASQRGYYPDALEKANQDSFLISENFLEDPNCHMFGVFDGHGSVGDLCSHFCAQNFKKHLAIQIQSAHAATKSEHGDVGMPLDVLNNEILLEQVLKGAFNCVNKELHDNTDIDDSLSGTTGIAVIVQGDAVHVGNVGDSRAIIASFDHKAHRLRFFPLSNDQTPFRKDERARLRKCGAKILSVDQIDEDQPEHDMWGEDGFESEDPPRVWDSTLEAPGCGFTRSLGDAEGEKVGVCSDPEVLSWKLTPDDKYIIIGSDGVFEFLSSNVVIDMTNKVINKTKDPAEAVRHIISEAFRLWVAHDDRTDDITMILLSLDHYKVKNSASIADAQQQRQKDASSEVVNKRMKAILPAEKVMEMKSYWKNNASNEKYDFKKYEVKKDPEETLLLAYFISISLLFSAFNSQQQMNLCRVARKESVPAKKMIFAVDYEVDYLYIVQEGEFAVFQLDDNGIEHRITTLTSAGAVFGDISMLYGYTSAVKVVAMTSGVVWTVSRKAFRAIVSGNKQGTLSDKDLNQICQLLSN